MSLGVKVLDWQTDLIPGSTILEQIQHAASICTGGIFLLTRDDDLMNSKLREKSAPRDNVVFEAGYFIGLKGKRNVLIVRETGSKMPADLGGDIYASLKDKSDLGSVEKTIQGFIKAF